MSFLHSCFNSLLSGVGPTNRGAQVLDFVNCSDWCAICEMYNYGWSVRVLQNPVLSKFNVRLYNVASTCTACNNSASCGGVTASKKSIVSVLYIVNGLAHRPCISGSTHYSELGVYVRKQNRHEKNEKVRTKWAPLSYSCWRCPIHVALRGSDTKNRIGINIQCDFKIVWVHAKSL